MKILFNHCILTKAEYSELKINYEEYKHDIEEANRTSKYWRDLYYKGYDSLSNNVDSLRNELNTLYEKYKEEMHNHLVDLEMINSLRG